MPEAAGQETISQELEQACAAEPIHLIGTVQPHGFTLVVELESGRIVRVSSGIAAHWPGLGAASRLLLAPAGEWLDVAGLELQALLDSLPSSDPIVLSLQPRSAMRGGALEPPTPATDAFECVGHRVGGLAILEWQPLGSGAAPAPDAVPGTIDIRATIAGMRNARTLELFFRDCVREVFRLSGFDRVMLYRFLPDWSGEVIAERAAAELKTRFLGLRFPASDIPTQARALYTRNKIRILADVDAAPDTLLPAVSGGEPLDQSHSLLRGFSEVHRTYLRNMGVRATMSLSILCGGRLWGLIACHHYQPRIPPHHVRTALRQVCELVAEVSMLRIEALQQLQAAGDTVALDQTLLLLQQELLQEEDPQVVLHRQLPELLSAFDASALCVRIGKLSYVGGESGADATPEDALDDLAGMLEPSRTAAGVVQRLDLHGPGAAALRTLPVAAGVLVAHQFGESLELCAFTRPEMVTEVHWAGAPTKQLTALPDGRVVLEPRRSFELWSEQVGGTARPWLPAQAEACERLLRILSDNFKRREHKTLEQELRWRAHHDHLTGLYNRRSVEESLEQRMGASRYESAVMLIDLDHFKMINDTHGHGAGDRLLQELSLRLSAVIRPTDILSRVGGDEFLLLAEMSVPEPALALAMAARLHKAMEEPFVIDGQLQRLSISVGIAIPPGHGTNATDLMRRADLALYRAKHSGRASTVIFDAALEAGLSASYELERDLQDAIARNELSLVFQPEVDLGSGRVVGLEALLRWQHPTRGAIEPSVFIPLAERSDLITKLGQWVARTALATQATWRQNTDFNVPVALNVSMMEVLSGKLVEQIGALLREFKLPAGCLGVELTESVIMKDLVLTKNVLRGLRQLGVATALDDFGTGYSSLSYLRQLPLSCLKVDQSFTADLTRDAHSRSLTQAIIRMAEALKMTTIAEGVETRGQLSWLREHECTIGQGYLFSHPVIAPMVQSSIERIEAGWHGLQ